MLELKFKSEVKEVDMNNPAKPTIGSILLLFLFSFTLMAQNPSDGLIEELVVELDINDDDGILYQEQVVQVFLKIKNF